MHDYMEYLVRCFNVINNWDESNLYPSVIATPKSILDFDLPKSVSFNINKRSSDYSANSLTLSNTSSINGSIAYFYSSLVLRNVVSSANVSLQDAVSTYQFVDSVSAASTHNTQLAQLLQHRSPAKLASTNTNILLYGKLNFPSNILEALVIKNFSPTSRLLVKCLSTNSNLIKNHGILTVYYQKNYPKYSNEFIFSSNEGLLGFRNLYNITLSSPNDEPTFESSQPEHSEPSLRDKNFYDNSKLSIGTELWYGTLHMTPGISNSLRYSTYSTYTGKPLTITLSCNPLIGLISSTYTVKTALNSTFCLKYDFNIYSYESNLSLGCELWNFNGNLSHEINKILTINNDFKKLIKKKNIPGHFDSSLLIETNRNAPKEKQSSYVGNTNIDKFKDLYKNINFLSVLKLSTSLNQRNLRVLWEGKYKDFLLEVGCNISPFKKSFSESDKRDSSYIPDISRFGISVQYNS